MTGTVSRLVLGANVLELLSQKGSSDKFDEWDRGWDRGRDDDQGEDALARLTVARATPPSMSCSSLASLAGFPVQSGHGISGTTITSATLVAATATLPEYCRVQGILQERTGIAGVLGTVSFRANQPYQRYQRRFHAVKWLCCCRAEWRAPEHRTATHP